MEFALGVGEGVGVGVSLTVGHGYWYIASLKGVLVFGMRMMKALNVIFLI